MTTISSLPNMSSPQTNDLFCTVDVNDISEAPTGTTKKLSFATLQSFFRSLVMTPVTFKPAAPAATASLSLVMGGLGSTIQITPISSGLVAVDIVGEMFTNTAVAQTSVGGRYGTVTGGVPANGAAVIGTRWGNNGDFVLAPPATITQGVPFHFTDLLTLTPGTAYWLDLAYDTGSAADTAVPRNICFRAIETS